MTTHVTLNRFSDFGLVLVSGGVGDALFVLSCSSVVVDIESGHGSRWVLLVIVESANLFMDFGVLSCLRVLKQVVSQLGSRTDFLFNGLQHLCGVDLALAVVFVDFEETLALLFGLKG